VGVRALNKLEALGVLREIHEALDANVSVTCVSLDPEQEKNVVVGYGLRMKCELNDISRQTLNVILSKHKLTLREERGYVFICKED
jgi:hypothetical protein